MHLQRSHYLLFMAVSCGYSAFGSTLQILPKHLFNQFQSTPHDIAMIISIASLGAALTRPLVGQWSTNGFNKHCIVIGAFLAFIGGIGHRIAWSTTSIIAARILLGAGEGILFTSAITKVILEYPQQQRAGIAGWFGLSMWGGLSIGPILSNEIQILYPNNLNVLWDFIGLLLLLGFGFAFLAIRHKTETQSDQQKLKTSSSSMSAAVAPCLAFLLASYGYGSVNANLIIMLYHHHLGGETLVLPIFAISFLICRIIGSPLLSLANERSILLTLLCIESIGLLFLSIPELSLILIGTILSGSSISLLYPTFVSLLLKRINHDNQGRGIGLMTSCWDIGLVLAGGGGALALLISFSWVFYLSGLCSIWAFFIILLLKKDLQHDKTTTA